MALLMRCDPNHAVYVHHHGIGECGVFTYEAGETQSGW